MMYTNQIQSLSFIPHGIIILSTGDNYILSQKTHHCDTAIKLYEMMDVSIEKIQTHVYVDSPQFIFDNIGRIISTGFYDTDGSTRMDVVSKLIEDVKKTQEFYKIRKFWKGLSSSDQSGEPHNPRDPRNDSCNESCSDLSPEATAILQTWREELGLLQRLPPIMDNDPMDNPASTDDSIMRELKEKDNKQECMQDNGTKALDMFHVHIKTPSEKDIKKTFPMVLFNTIYNICLVVDNDVDSNDFLVDVKYMLLWEQFPEFKLICKLHPEDGYTDALLAQFKSFFHKKSFESVRQLNAKMVAFRELHNIYPLARGTKAPEKARVKEFLDSRYILSSDPDKRMKANDLYKELINNLVVPMSDASMFKKRVAGYLMEFNIHKKRFSDAYYYYGISSRETSNQINVQDIEKQREADRKEWFYKAMST